MQRQPITRRPGGSTALRRLIAPTAFLLALPCSACATWVRDQVKVPGTNQRLLVGSDDWPTKKVWVLEDGKIQPVKIVMEKR